MKKMQKALRREGAIGNELDYIRERNRAVRLERALAALSKRDQEIRKHGDPSPIALRHSIRDFRSRLHATRARMADLERRLPSRPVESAAR